MAHISNELLENKDIKTTESSEIIKEVNGIYKSIIEKKWKELKTKWENREDTDLELSFSLLNDLVSSPPSEFKELNKDYIGFMYGWREEMFSYIKKINEIIPETKSFNEQLNMSITDLIEYLEKIGVGGYSDPHVDLLVIRRLKQHRLRLREDISNLGVAENSEDHKIIDRITALIGEIDKDDPDDNEYHGNEFGDGSDDDEYESDSE